MKEVIPVTINNVKGTMDFLPEEQIIRNNINNTLKNTFEEYGYLPIETPILCYYDMLSGKYDEANDILKEIYKLKDQGNRELGLRYDLTVPFAKFIALNKNKVSFPFKRYEINKVFRDGPVKVGRDREFTQCDVDVVGIEGQAIEAELLSLYVSAFQKLGIDLIIKYNSRNLMTGLIKECNIPDSLTNSVITIIDKINKISEKEFQEELSKLNINEQQIKELKRYFQQSLSDLRNELQETENETLKKGIEELTELEKFLKGLNIDAYCIFDPSLARGQDYYTGNVFEVYEKNGKITGSIGGGGRYDNMITDFINDKESYPAVGISFGLTSIFELLKDKALNNNLYDLYIIPMDTEIESLILANKLRNKGIKVIVEMNHKKIKKAYSWANKNNIPYVTVIGDDEIKNQSIKIKDMNNSKEISVGINNIDEIVEIVKNEEYI